MLPLDKKIKTWYNTNKYSNIIRKGAGDKITLLGA